MRKALAGLALAVVALVAAGAGPHRLVPAAAAAASSTTDGLNHAAIVVDTGDGQVRKMCLAFPEPELDGIEALRRVDTRPYRFETFGTKGAGVCMLCGVGCPSGDCFCDPSKYWAYFRAGPGGEPYTASRVGASSTSVRNGDVEGWRWGKGEAPPATTVSETCGVDEPPKRTASTTTTSAPPTTDPPPSDGGGAATTTTTTTAVPSAAPRPAAAPVAPGSPAAPRQPTAATSVPDAGSTTTTSTSTSSDPAAGAADADGSSQPDRATRSAAKGLDGSAASAATGDDRGSSTGSVAGAVGFALVLGGLLVWRIRLRRANAANAAGAAKGATAVR